MIFAVPLISLFASGASPARLRACASFRFFMFAFSSLSLRLAKISPPRPFILASKNSIAPFAIFVLPTTFMLPFSFCFMIGSRAARFAISTLKSLVISPFLKL